MFNPKTLKKDFPLLQQNLIYLDSASSSQKPQRVIDKISEVYQNCYANIHRGIYRISEEATAAYEATRTLTQQFINARETREIIFTKNCTEAINLVASSFGEAFIKKGDEIIVSQMEHHSNLVPWQELCRRKQAKLQVIPLRDDLTLNLDIYKKLLNPKTKLVAITAMSNVLGTIPPLEKIIKLAHQQGAKVLLDGAQSVAHSPTDVQKLDCDFLTFSAHKMLGPSGVGVLYGKAQLLEAMPPFLFGGDMILSVGQYQSTYNEIPWKFEAGTPNIADVIAFAEAIKYLQKVGLDNIRKHEEKLSKYAMEKLSAIPQIALIGPKANHSGIISFTIEGIHPHDIAGILNEDNICIRAGHHCAEPLMKHLKLSATARASFYLYNEESDIDALTLSLQKAIKIFA